MYIKINNIKRITILILTITVTWFQSHGLDESFSIDKIEPFNLKSVNGEMYKNKDLMGKTGAALIFLSNHCKVSQQFQKNIILRNSIWIKQGIKLTVISPNYENAILPDELAYTDVGDSFEEMKDLFSDIPEAVNNTVKISEMCDVTLDLDTTKIPEFKIEDGSDPMSYLQKICAEGFLKLFSKNTFISPRQGFKT